MESFNSVAQMWQSEIPTLLQQQPTEGICLATFFYESSHWQQDLVPNFV